VCKPTRKPIALAAHIADATAACASGSPPENTTPSSRPTRRSRNATTSGHRDLRDQIPVIAGREMPFSYGELQREMDLINRAYIGRSRQRLARSPIRFSRCRTGRAARHA